MTRVLANDDMGVCLWGWWANRRARSETYFSNTMPTERLTFWLMNAMADDWESLEQIHPAVNESCGPTDAEAVAAELFRLLQAGMLEAMPVAPGSAAAIVVQASEYWFRMTPAGRELWEKMAKTINLGA